MRMISIIVSSYIIIICLITVIRVKLKQRQDEEETDYKIMLRQLQDMEEE